MLSVQMMIMEHDSAGDALRSIREASAEFTPPADACISYQTLYRALQEFEADLHQHIHLENNVLFPKAVALEAAVERGEHGHARINPRGEIADGNARLERDVPCAVDGVRAGLHHVAEHRVLDPLRLHARALERGTGRDGAERTGEPERLEARDRTRIPEDPPDRRLHRPGVTPRRREPVGHRSCWR